MMHALAILPVVALTGVGYSHVGSAHGVEVYRRLGSPVIDLMAEGDFEAPPARVREIVLDYAKASELSEHIVESRVLASNGPELIVYQRLALPVVADRDFTLHVWKGARGDVLWTRFAVDNSRGPEATPEVVRLSLLNGGWDLAPIRDGRATHAVYRVQIDLAGSIPRWMASDGAARDLPKLFEGIRRQCLRPTLATTDATRRR
jgi:hypothetical protein